MKEKEFYEPLMRNAWQKSQLSYQLRHEVFGLIRKTIKITVRFYQQRRSNVSK